MLLCRVLFTPPWMILFARSELFTLDLYVIFNFLGSNRYPNPPRIKQALISGQDADFNPPLQASLLSLPSPLILLLAVHCLGNEIPTSGSLHELLFLLK